MMDSNPVYSNNGNMRPEIVEVFLGEMDPERAQKVLVDYLIAHMPPSVDNTTEVSDAFAHIRAESDSKIIKYDGEEFYTIPNANIAISEGLSLNSSEGYSNSTIYRVIGYTGEYAEGAESDFSVVGSVYLRTTFELSSWGYDEGVVGDLEIVYPHAHVQVTYNTNKEGSLGDIAWRNRKSTPKELSIEDYEFVASPRYSDQAFGQELETIGLNRDDPGVDGTMWANCMRIADLVHAQGHSGFSFSYLSRVMKRYFSSEPILSPLTGEDSEWVDVSDLCEYPCWQNRRMSSVFKEMNADGSYHYYWSGGRVFYNTYTDENGELHKMYFTNRDSDVTIDGFPWMPPEKEYVEVKDDDHDGGEQ